MGKHTTPRGVKYKEKCIKCKLLFYPIVLLGGKLTRECQNCNSEASLPQKK